MGYRIDTNANVIKLDVLEVFGTHRSQTAHPVSPQKHESATLSSSCTVATCFANLPGHPGPLFGQKFLGVLAFLWVPVPEEILKFNQFLQSHLCPHASAKSSQTSAEQRYPDQTHHCVISTKLSQVVSTQ